MVAMAVSVTASCTSGGAEASDTTSRTDAVKVTVAGDSISLGLGVTMREEFEGGDITLDGSGAAGERSGELEVKAIGIDGTGLARPDNFDWPRRLEELATDFPPDVLVLSVGSNDGQDLTDADGDVVATMADSQAWDDEYRSRLARAFDAFADTGTQVVWLGHVRTEDDLVADTNRHIHDLATEVASTRDWVTVADLAELTGSGAQSTSQCLRSDGLHLSAECYAGASGALLEQIGSTG